VVILSPRKGTGYQNRFLPEARTLENVCQSPGALGFDSGFSEQLYSGLIQGIHPDRACLAGVSVRKLYNQRHKRSSYIRALKKPIATVEVRDVPSDFYVQPLDWSERDVIAFSRKRGIWLISARSLQACKCFESVEDSAAVCFAGSGESVLIGTSSGYLVQGDCESGEVISCNGDNGIGISVIRTIGEAVIIGDHSGCITLVDPRSDKVTPFKCGHSLEVCNVAVSPDGYRFASGGNDKLVKIWDLRNIPSCLVRYRQHGAAVRALAWSPARSSIIASGGGSCDRSLRIWDSDTGETFMAVQTGSQICNLYWSEASNTILSTHGFAGNGVYLWRGSNLDRVSGIDIHRERVLYLASSPDKEQVLTMAPGDNAYIWDLQSRDLETSQKMMFSLR
jgi:WD40 repeat protein